MKKHRGQRQLFLFLFFIVLMLISLVLFPAAAVEGGKTGLTLCLTTLFPSLFPFMVLAGMMTASGVMHKLTKPLAPAMRRLFHLPGAGASALLFGFLGGYPVGAKTAAELYHRSVCTKEEAERLLSFCNNCGPAFILGALGAGVFQSAKAGFLLLFSHILSALITGLFLGRHGKTGASSNTTEAPLLIHRTSFSSLFVNAVTSSMQAMLNICGFVVFFAVIIRILESLGIFTKLSDILLALTGSYDLASSVEALAFGFFELTSGIGEVFSIKSSTPALMVSSFLLGWGGLSVHFQTLSVLEGSGLGTKRYFGGKLLQGVLSACITFLFSRFFAVKTISVSVLAPGQTAKAFEVFPIAFLIIGFFLCFIGFYALFWFFRRKS